MAKMARVGLAMTESTESWPNFCLDCFHNVQIRRYILTICVVGMNKDDIFCCPSFDLNDNLSNTVIGQNTRKMLNICSRKHTVRTIGLLWRIQHEKGGKLGGEFCSTSTLVSESF